MPQYTQPILEGVAVSALIPQKPPIEMVDKLWYNDQLTTVSGFTISDKNIFCTDGFFRAPGLVENIAQTAALRVGYIVSEKRKEIGEEKTSPPVGYIGAIKNLRIMKFPPVGSEIKTEVTIQNVIFDVTLIKGIVTLNNETIAECEMKIFLKK